MQHTSAFREDVIAELQSLVFVHVIQINIYIWINDQINDAPVKPSERQLDVKDAILAAPRPCIVYFVDQWLNFEVRLLSVYCVLQRSFVVLICSDQSFEHIFIF